MSRPTSAPTTRPVLPRTSSAASGLRFCGMIEEPVEKASESRTKPNCGVVHSTISSAKRERWVAQIAAAPSASSAKSRSATESSELAVGRSKPSAFAVIARSIGKEVPASAAAPSGHSLRRLRASRKAPGVAAEHLDIGEQVMAEGDRLGRLQMGEARHHHVGASSARVAERPLQAGDLEDERVDRVAHPEAEVDRDLVVARTRGVQAPGGRTDDLGEAALDVHMDVFERAREGEGPRLDFALDLVETLGDGLRVRRVDHALFGEHGDMGEGAGDVLGGELAVEADRGVDLLHDFGRADGEPAAPHRVAHDE